MSFSTLFPVYHYSVFGGYMLLFHQSTMRIVCCVWQVFLHLWRGCCKIFVYCVSSS